MTDSITDILNRIDEVQRQMDDSVKYSDAWVACCNRLDELFKQLREASEG